MFGEPLANCRCNTVYDACLMTHQWVTSPCKCILPMISYVLISTYGKAWHSFANCHILNIVYILLILKKVGASHMLRWWFGGNLTLWNKLQWNINRNSFIFTQENTLEDVVCEMSAILSRPQYVNMSELTMANRCCFIETAWHKSRLNAHAAHYCKI